MLGTGLIVRPVTEIDPQMLKGLLAVLVLSLLTERDDYGYSLVERLRAGGLDEIVEGTVYPALARLEQGGFVSTYHVPSSRGPARKYYAITDTGRRELGERMGSWRRLVSVLEHVTKEIAP